LTGSGTEGADEFAAEGMGTVEIDEATEEEGEGGEEKGEGGEAVAVGAVQCSVGDGGRKSCGLGCDHLFDAPTLVFLHFQQLSGGTNLRLAPIFGMSEDALQVFGVQVGEVGKGRSRGLNRFHQVAITDDLLGFFFKASGNRNGHFSLPHIQFMPQACLFEGTRNPGDIPRIAA